MKPREAWLLNRNYTQPGEHVGTMFEGIALQMKAAAQASQRYAANIGEALKRLAAIAQQATAWTRPKTQPCQQAMP